MRKIKIEFLANLAIILSTIVFIYVVVDKFYLTPNKNINSLLTGKTLSVPEIDWKRNNFTAILALQESCRYCTESADFYKRLAKENQVAKNIPIIAVLPGKIESSQSYLARLGLNVKEIRQLPLASLNVNSTPSLLIVDNTGKVVASWVGKLDSPQENDLITKIKTL